MMIALVLALLLSGARTDGMGEPWPGWRGPRGDGTTTQTLPLKWSTTHNIAWKVSIPGKGHSSPIVWGERLFLTTCVESTKERCLLCLDRLSGKLLWQRTVLTAPLEDKHKLNSFASSTPVTDGRHVWVTFLDYPHLRVYCYDFEGNLIWTTAPGEFHSKHGFCSSPVLFRDLVIVNGDQDAEAYLVALDKATGKERWRTDRPNRTRSYCVPLIVEAAGKTQMVLTGSKCVASYDPATGKQHWLMDGPTEQFVASMVYRHGLFCLTGGYPDFHLMALRPDGVGTLGREHVVWHERRGAAYVPSPVAVGDWLFVVSDHGVASCLELKTGKRLWMERLGRRFSAAPIATPSHVYFPDDDGITHVVRAGPKFAVVSRNHLEDECYASPAVAEGCLYIRTLGYLWCVREGR